MKKKIVVKIMACALAVTAFGSMTACSGGGAGIVKDPLTLNVRVRKAGYGTEYINALAEQFEKTFEAEGYKVNILTPREDLVSTVVYRDIYSAKEGSGVDVYFTSDIDAEKAVTGDFGQVFADMTDSVWKQKPIKFDGTEEALTVEEKMSGIEFPDGVYNGRIYGLPYAYGMGGLVVNKAKLDSYGLELPRTTEELFACAEKILETSLDTGTFPFTYSMSGNNYPASVVNAWMAQYGGLDEFNSYWSFENPDGTKMEGDCYKVFEYDFIEETLKLLYRMYDPAMGAWGVGSQDFTAAQGQLMKGEAVFYACGNWFLNEEYERYNRYVNDVTFISTPMISSLGEKLFGAECGEKTDKVLSAIVKCADEGMTAEQAKASVETEFSVSLDSADVQTVYERRGYVRGNINAGLVISEKSTKKDLANLFVRFCASTEAGALWAEKARGISPFALGADVNSDVPFLASVNKITAYSHHKALVAMETGYRKSMGVVGIFPYMGEIFATKIYSTSVSKYDLTTRKLLTGKNNGIYTTAAQALANDMYLDAKNNVETGKWKVIEK